MEITRKTIFDVEQCSALPMEKKMKIMRQHKDYCFVRDDDGQIIKIVQEIIVRD